VLEPGFFSGLEAGSCFWRWKRVLGDGILILGFWSLGLVGSLGWGSGSQPESLILAQNERWRHA
jgi:hypothetical protein